MRTQPELQVTCPVCQAAAGSKCVAVACMPGKEMGTAHSDRAVIAARTQNAERAELIRASIAA